MKSTVFSELTGKTLVRVDVSEDEVRFVCDCGQEYLMKHEQDCCERVVLEDVVGDFDDLLGRELLLAEETSGETHGCGKEGIWTFYKLATLKGAVTLRWLGDADSYYSVDVSVYRLHEALHLAQQQAARLAEVMPQAQVTTGRSSRRL